MSFQSKSRKVTAVESDGDFLGFPRVNSENDKGEMSTKSKQSSLQGVMLKIEAVKKLEKLQGEIEIEKNCTVYRGKRK